MNLKEGALYLLGAMVISAGVTVSATAHAAPITMKIGVATINESQHQWMKIYAALVEKNSNGRIKVELYPGGQLGSNPRMLEGTQFGSIQASVAPPELLSGVDSRYQVLSAPGLFKNLAHAGRTLQDPQFNAAYLALGANKGLKGIGLFLIGPLAFNTRMPVRKLADLEGKKIRVLASEMQMEQVHRLKAAPVPMSFSEVLPALQTGTIDGMLTAVTTCAAVRCYDAAKYLYETSQAIFCSIAVVSKIWFDGLPPDLQKVVVESGRTASNEVYQWSIDFVAAQREVWLKAGGEITYPSAAEQAQLMELMLPIGAQIVSKNPGEKALYETLLKAAKRAE